MATGDWSYSRRCHNAAAWVPPEPLRSGELFLVAMILETKAYLEKRRQGEIAKLSSWCEFLRSYPAMRRGRSAGSAGS